MGEVYKARDTRLDRTTRPAPLRHQVGCCSFARVLVAQRFDAVKGALAGDQVTVADAVVVDSNLSTGAFSVSAAGPIAYRSAVRSVLRAPCWSCHVRFVLGARCWTCCVRPHDTHGSAPRTIGT